MFFRLLLLFTVLPLTELLLLIWVKDHTSWPFTILLVLTTGVVGAALARWQGWRTVQRIQEELAKGRMPTDALWDGLLILIAGAVLVTPGVLTDAVGFLLLVPPCRHLIKRWMAARLKHRFTVSSSFSQWQGPAGNPFDRDSIIDAKVIDSPPSDGDENPPDE